MTILKIFEIKFAYLTNDTDKTSITNHIYHYTTPVVFKLGSAETWGSVKAPKGFHKILIKPWVFCMFL
jgi:hypothetical protein